MAAEIALAIAIVVHLSLTAAQNSGVLVMGFVIPVLFVVGATTMGLGRGDWELVGFLLVLSVPFSYVMLFGLLVFGAVTLGS